MWNAAWHDAMVSDAFDCSGSMFGFHGIGMFLVLGSIVLMTIFLVRRSSSHRDDPAAETLGRRYAAGEISADDYSRMKKDLRR